VELVITAYQENQNVNLEVFVHKAEALSEEYKIGEWFPWIITTVYANATQKTSSTSSNAC
jgi:hypothetical protein